MILGRRRATEPVLVSLSATASLRVSPPPAPSLTGTSVTSRSVRARMTLRPRLRLRRPAESLPQERAQSFEEELPRVCVEVELSGTRKDDDRELLPFLLELLGDRHAPIGRSRSVGPAVEPEPSV